MEFQIPAGLTDMLQEFTIAVLREKPEDMVDFAATYFTQLKLLSSNAERASHHTDEKESDQEGEEEEPLGGLLCFNLTVPTFC